MKGFIERKNGTKLSKASDVNCVLSRNIHGTEKVEYIKMEIINGNKNNSNSNIFGKNILIVII